MSTIEQTSKHIFLLILKYVQLPSSFKTLNWFETPPIPETIRIFLFSEPQQLSLLT